MNKKRINYDDYRVKYIYDLQYNLQLSMLRFGGHLIVTKLAQREQNINLIPKNMINYTAILTPKFRIMGMFFAFDLRK